MVTMKEIAEEAGVSIVTVSNVIHENYNRVSAENIEKINKLIEKYHYVPNSNARSLAMKKSRIIGVIIPNVNDDENFMKSPFNAEIIGILEKVIREADYYLMVRSVNKTIDAIPLISSWNVDGVVFLGAFKEDIVAIKKRLTLPMVFVDTYGEGIEYVNVGSEDMQGGYLAAGYLIGKGHENIAFVGPSISGEGVINERYLGYEKAMKEHGFGDNINVVTVGSTSFEAGIEAAKKIAFLDADISAVFATADILAIGIMEGLRQIGKQVPDDVSVVGFDNLPESVYCCPKLTTISQNMDLKAKTIGKTILSMVNEKEESTSASSIKVDVNLIERNSVSSRK